MDNAPSPSTRPTPWLRLMLAGLAIASIGVLALWWRDAGPGPGPSPSVAVGETAAPSPTPTRPLTPVEPSPTAAEPSSRPAVSTPTLTPDEQAFASAYLSLAEAFDRRATDLMIANPLAEFDLVGTQLTDLIDRTREQLTDLPLPPLDPTAARVRDLDREMAAVVALLGKIDPHGPRVVQAEQYAIALDYWIGHVKPITDAIRAVLGLVPSEGGDLRL